MKNTTTTKKKMGRPSSYTEEIGDLICERLESGESLRTICLDKNVPSFASVMRWLGNDEYENFRNQYARARELQADFYAESVVNIADEHCDDAVAVGRNRLRCDARRWYASKLLPKKYGDKIDMTSGGEVMKMATIVIPALGSDSEL